MYKTFLTQDNHPITIEVPPPSCTPSFFVFALHKSGSTMLNGIIEVIAHHLQIPLVSIAQSSYAQGFEEDELNKEICSLFTQTGYGFYGSRYLPSYLEGFDLSRFKKILLVRDPRDILVSLHFSIRQSHSVADGKVGEEFLDQRKIALETDIDHHVFFWASFIKNRFEQYRRIEDRQCKRFRYEDIVFEKAQLIRDILAFLELSLDDATIHEIAQRFDVFPEQEDPSAHIRKVTPGDYKQKLKPETIAQLNDFFRDILNRYQYS